MVDDPKHSSTQVRSIAMTKHGNSTNPEYEFGPFDLAVSFVCPVINNQA